VCVIAGTKVLLLLEIIKLKVNNTFNFHHPLKKFKPFYENWRRRSRTKPYLYNKIISNVGIISKSKPEQTNKQKSAKKHIIKFKYFIHNP